MVATNAAESNPINPKQPTNIPPKPQRPLTVFHLFSKLERNYILQQTQERSPNPADRTVDPYLAMRPARYRGLVLPSDWFVVGGNKVKRHKHVNHGLITFEELTKVLSERWESADDEIRLYCNWIASAQREKYRADMAAYKETYGEDAIKAQKRTYKKRRKVDRNEDRAPQVASAHQHINTMALGQQSIALLSNPPNHPMLEEFAAKYLVCFAKQGKHGNP